MTWLETEGSESMRCKRRGKISGFFDVEDGFLLALVVDRADEDAGAAQDEESSSETTEPCVR